MKGRRCQTPEPRDEKMHLNPPPRPLPKHPYNPSLTYTHRPLQKYTYNPSLKCHPNPLSNSKTCSKSGPTRWPPNPRSANGHQIRDHIMVHLPSTKKAQICPPQGIRRDTRFVPQLNSKGPPRGIPQAAPQRDQMDTKSVTRKWAQIPRPENDHQIRA